MVWWEAVLSPALQVLFDKLASGDVLELLRRWNINDLLIEKLKIAYFTCTVVIDDAEEKQYYNPAIETWLDMLKHAVYEAEDALDLLATEALRCKVEVSPQNFSSQVRNWNILATNFGSFGEGMKVRIESIIDKLEFIAKQKDILGLETSGKGMYGMINRLPTTPLLVESGTYGRHSEKEEIIKLVLSNNGTSNNGFSVVPIMGMGGIGKTTLAQIVYNDKRIDEAFDVKAWACVSDDFNVINITKALLESLTAKPCETMNLELLQMSLKQMLNKKRFLIVLDDVWNENFENWNELSIPFMVGHPRSSIIVTTRNEGVVTVMKALPPYRLKEMSDPECWLLFLHHTLGVEGSEKYLNLKQIGREIVKKCKGLPLAVKMLGGLLAGKLDFAYWNQILNSNLWDLPRKENSILSSLRLSYHHLPSSLKRCFAYCSLFPKGYEFERKKLVLLWMAEGFVQPGEKISMEEVGDEYFSELLSRSFFEESVVDRSRYVMHDLINDLAGSVSRISCIRQEENWQTKDTECSEKAHHFSFIRSKYDVFKRFESLTESVSLRTVLPLGSVSGTQVCFLSKTFPCDLLPKFKCLRVLSLSCYFITELPESIGNLRLLRYIDLSYTRIKNLPESLNVLYNLQTLLLCHCADLNKLPANIGKLINLRHLDISGSGIQAMPIGIDNLVSLRWLPEFVLGSVGSRGSATQEMPTGVDNVVSPPFLPEFGLGIVGSRIGGLRNLLHLQGSLSISGLENVDNFWDARNANLKGKQTLNALVMEWSSTLSELQNDRVATDVLEMLQPHQNLEKLTIKSYGGKKFPTWIGDPSFSKLVHLSVSDCKRCRFLPPLGCLPLLKHLYIKGMEAVKSIGAEFYGYSASSSKPFASLETLSFKQMMEWEDWLLPACDKDIEVFPNLQELQIEKCPKLRQKLPEQLPSLVKLFITECEMLSVSLPQLPRLQFLNIRGCNYMLLSSNIAIHLLASFELHNISNLKYLPEWLLQYIPTLLWLVIVDCSDLVHLARYNNGLQYLTSLQHLVIRNYSMLVSLFEEEQQLPQKLEYLELDSCHSLKKLPHALHSLTALQEMIITDCPRLEFVPGTIFPSNLKGLALRGCGLDLLPETMINIITSLEYLCIDGCLVLSSFPGEGRQVPTTFKQLTIDQCPSLELLPGGITHTSNIFLELLEIFDCSSITSFPAGHLPTTLKVLTIWNCFNLESLADVATDSMSLESLRIGNCTNLICLPNSLNKLGRLDYLEIAGCPGIVTFPEGGLPTSSLKKLHIIDCENLKFLPESMLSLTSLKELKLSNCPSITSLPEGGFPINLVSLEIKECKNIIPFSEWGLHRLASLEKLKIYGGCLDIVFPEWLLPSTLDTLHIGKLSKLESLSPWLQHLTSLEELKIMECHKLFSLPKEGVPPMLSFLEIRGCPLLQQDCEKNWSQIDHIPCIVNHL